MTSCHVRKKICVLSDLSFGIISLFSLSYNFHPHFQMWETITNQHFYLFQRPAKENFVCSLHKESCSGMLIVKAGGSERGV